MLLYVKVVLEGIPGDLLGDVSTNELIIRVMFICVSFTPLLFAIGDFTILLHYTDDLYFMFAAL